MNKKDEFKPYIPADRVMPELTVTSIIMGVLLAVIFGVNMRIPNVYRIARVTCNGAIRRHLNARVKSLKSHYDPDGIRTIFCSPSISVITSTGIWRLRSAWISGYTAKRSPCT